VGPFAFWHGSSFAETTTKTFIRILRLIAALLFATFPRRPPFPVRIKNSVTLGQVLGRLGVFLCVVGFLQEQGTDVASVDSSTSTVEIANAAHFFDMYINNHDGKHMNGDRMKILFLNLPFLLRDLIEPEMRCIRHT
jgi:hypothetical protein